MIHYHPFITIHSLPSIHYHPLITIHSLPSIHYHPYITIHSLPSINYHPYITIHTLPSIHYHPYITSLEVSLTDKHLFEISLYFWSMCPWNYMHSNMFNTLKYSITPWCVIRTGHYTSCTPVIIVSMTAVSQILCITARSLDAETTMVTHGWTMATILECSGIFSMLNPLETGNCCENRII